MTFDLEKARKIVDAMSPTPWIVLEDRYGQIDVIRNPNHPMHKEGVIELWGMTSETATPDAIGISYMRSEFPNALDEIERLRGEMENYGDDYVCQMNSKDVRIQELEDALVEERARALWFEGDDPCDPPNLDWKTEPNDIPESVRLLWGESARQQLQAEGKIGPDADAKPHCWQITEERKAAIKELSELLIAIGCPSCHYYIQKNYGENITVLRAMLTEAYHDKP